MVADVGHEAEGARAGQEPFDAGGGAGLRVDDPGQAVEGGRRDRLRGVGAEGRGGRCEQDEAVVEYEGVVEQAVVAGWRVDERDVDLAPA